MHALILAAGIGNRLGDAANNRPKSLLEFDGISLLQRHIECLSRLEITGITVITGYESEQITATINNLDYPSININTIHNDRYREGSVISLWTGQPVFDNPGPVLLMDADVLYSEKILQQLVQSQHENCFLLDQEFEAGDEPVKICIHQQRIVEFRKQVATGLEYDLQGESVGFFRFAGEAKAMIMAKTGQYLDQQRFDQPYEEVLRDVVLEHPQWFHYEDITGLPWIEIDFAEDVERAKLEILPQINN